MKLAAFMALISLLFAATSVSAKSSKSSKSSKNRRTLHNEPTKGFIFRRSISLHKGDKPPAGKISGNTWDLGGLTIDGRDSGDCCDSEGGPKVTIHWKGLTIRNGRFANWPDGVGIAAPDVSFENVAFENCEDCLNTSKGARNWTIRGCFFRAAPLKTSRQNGYPGDKAFQANVSDGSNLIEGCTFSGFRNAIRAGSQKYRKSAGSIVIRNNRFLTSATAIHAVAGYIVVDPHSNLYLKVPQPHRTESPGRLILSPTR